MINKRKFAIRWVPYVYSLTKRNRWHRAWSVLAGEPSKECAAYQVFLKAIRRA